MASRLAVSSIIVLIGMSVGLVGYFGATRSVSNIDSVSPATRGNGAATGPALSGIAGNISYGPTAPVCYVPLENQREIISPAPDWWSNVKVVLQREAGEKILVDVDWVEIDHCEIDGTFLAHVEPGNYTLTIIDTTSGKTIWYLEGTSLPLTITVELFQVVQVAVNLDTGIR